jgi:hypothetical protein
MHSNILDVWASVLSPPQPHPAWNTLIAHSPSLLFTFTPTRVSPTTPVHNAQSRELIAPPRPKLTRKVKYSTLPPQKHASLLCFSLWLCSTPDKRAIANLCTVFHDYPSPGPSSPASVSIFPTNGPNSDALSPSTPYVGVGAARMTHPFVCYTSDQSGAKTHRRRSLCHSSVVWKRHKLFHFVCHPLNLFSS